MSNTRQNFRNNAAPRSNGLSRARRGRGRPQRAIRLQNELGLPRGITTRLNPTQRPTNEPWRSGAPIAIATSPSGGTTVSSATPLAANGVNMGAITFSQLFRAWDEFFITGIKARVSAVGQNNGVVKMWFDENDGTSPVAATESALVQPRIIPANQANPKSQQTLRWSPKDFDDLTWLSVATESAQTLVWFKTYGSSADGLASLTIGEALFTLTPEFKFSFRGAGDAPVSASLAGGVVTIREDVVASPTPYSLKELRRKEREMTREMIRRHLSVPDSTVSDLTAQVRSLTQQLAKLPIHKDPSH